MLTTTRTGGRFKSRSKPEAVKVAVLTVPSGRVTVSNKTGTNYLVCGILIKSRNVSLVHAMYWGQDLVVWTKPTTWSKTRVTVTTLGGGSIEVHRTRPAGPGPKA